jgi:hypothetical protein
VTTLQEFADDTTAAAGAELAAFAGDGLLAGAAAPDE